MIGKTISHYKILEKIGQGGMGVVYRAQDIKLDRIVALKFLPAHLLQNEEAKTRFIHEAKAASAIDHPNIATVHDIDEVEGETFIAMAYIDGKSLKDIAGSETLDIHEAVDIAIQAAEGLGAAHKKDIVHRDIKSDNIMVTGDGLVKIMDFGLAKLKGVPGVTRAGSTVGTAHYMSPEQAKGEDIDHRSDIFSFGVVLYELVTGQFPFTGEYEPAVAYSIVNEPPKPMRELRPDAPVELEGIVAKALEKEPDARYQSLEELAADLKKLREGRTAEITAALPAHRSRRRILVPVLAVAAAAVAFAVGIQIKVGRQPPAEAAENILAVMYFENMADEEDSGRLGEIITNLLITDLSESQFVQVVSSQRLYDILKLLGKEGVKVIDKDVATQVAREASAKWMLTGTIAQIEPRMVLTAQIEDVSTGTIVASRQVRGGEGEDVFSVVDKLTLDVKRELELPDEALVEPDMPVADVTTSSPEAYRYYLEGMDYFSKAYLLEAEESFLKALEHDSTFAMAHFRLALTRGSRGDATSLQTIRKAVQFSDKATHKEQLYIKGIEAFMLRKIGEGIGYLKQVTAGYPDEKEAYFWLGAMHSQGGGMRQQSIPYLEKAIEIDPLYKDPYNMLAYTYEATGDFGKAIWAINEYISLAPNEANPYDTRGELYSYNGRIDEAIDSFEKALQIKPDFTPSLEHLGHMWLFKRDYLMAESYYKILASSDDKFIRSSGRAHLSLVALYQGRVREGLDILDQGITADTRDGFLEIPTGTKHVLKAHAYEAIGDLDNAVKEAETAVAIAREILPDLPVIFHGYYGHILALSGRIAEAEAVADEVKEWIEERDPSLMFTHSLLMGCIEFQRGNLETAIECLETGVEQAPAHPFGLEYALANAYLEAGRFEDAVAVLERRMSRYDGVRAEAPIWAVKMHYMLGMAYEESGQASRAIEQYETFLKIWENADPGIPEIEDAKRRLARLTS